MRGSDRLKPPDVCFVLPSTPSHFSHACIRGRGRDCSARRMGRGARSGLSWLSFTVCVGFPAKFLFCRPSINRSSSAISSGLLCLPPLWISSSLCINSAKFSMTSSKAAAARGPISFQRCSNITCQFGWSVGHPTYMKSLVRANV